MKKVFPLAALLVLALALSACASHTYWHIPRCELGSGQITQPIPGQFYKPAEPNVCVSYILPYDHAGWYESKMNTTRVRGRSVLKLGCTHCPEGGQDCFGVNDCGGCNTMTFNFDFTAMQEDAEIVAAKLAVYVVDNQENLTESVLEGRMNIGGDYAVVAGPPELLGKWVLYDITQFACRAVSERRNSASLELSLPCGAGSRDAMATVALGWGSMPEQLPTYEVREMKGRSPRILFEYR